MAQNKLDAINYLLEYLYQKVKPHSGFGTWDKDNLEKWIKATNTNGLPEGYEIKEYDEGDVISTESS